MAIDKNILQDIAELSEGTSTTLQKTKNIGSIYDAKLDTISGVQGKSSTNLQYEQDKLLGLLDADTFTLNSTGDSIKHRHTSLSDGNWIDAVDISSSSVPYDINENSRAQNQRRQVADIISKTTGVLYSPEEVTEQDFIDVSNMQKRQFLSDTALKAGENRHIEPFMRGTAPINVSGQYIDELGNPVSVPLNIDLYKTTDSNTDKYGRALSSIASLDGVDASKIAALDQYANAYNYDKTNTPVAPTYTTVGTDIDENEGKFSEAVDMIQSGFIKMYGGIANAVAGGAESIASRLTGDEAKADYVEKAVLDYAVPDNLLGEGVTTADHLRDATVADRIAGVSLEARQNQQKTMTDIKGNIEAGNYGAALKNSISILPEILADSAPETAMLFAGWVGIPLAVAVRVANHADEYRKNNNGEDPDAEWYLKSAAANTAVLGAERLIIRTGMGRAIGSYLKPSTKTKTAAEFAEETLKNMSKGVVRRGVEGTVKGVGKFTGRVGGSALISGAGEAVQEAADQAQEEFFTGKKEDMTLENLQKIATSSDTKTAAFLGAVAGSALQGSVEAVATPYRGYQQFKKDNSIIKNPGVSVEEFRQSENAKREAGSMLLSDEEFSTAKFVETLNKSTSVSGVTKDWYEKNKISIAITKTINDITNSKKFTDEEKTNLIKRVQERENMLVADKNIPNYTSESIISNKNTAVTTKAEEAVLDFLQNPDNTAKVLNIDETTEEGKKELASIKAQIFKDANVAEDIQIMGSLSSDVETKINAKVDKLLKAYKDNKTLTSVATEIAEDGFVDFNIDDLGNIVVNKNPKKPGVNGYRKLFFSGSSGSSIGILNEVTSLNNAVADTTGSSSVNLRDFSNFVSKLNSKIVKGTASGGRTKLTANYLDAVTTEAKLVDALVKDIETSINNSIKNNEILKNKKDGIVKVLNDLKAKSIETKALVDVLTSSKNSIVETYKTSLKKSETNWTFIDPIFRSSDGGKTFSVIHNAGKGKDVDIGTLDIASKKFTPNKNVTHLTAAERDTIKAEKVDTKSIKTTIRAANKKDTSPIKLNVRDIKKIKKLTNTEDIKQGIKSIVKTAIGTKKGKLVVNVNDLFYGEQDTSEYKEVITAFLEGTTKNKTQNEVLLTNIISEIREDLNKAQTTKQKRIPVDDEVKAEEGATKRAEESEKIEDNINSLYTMYGNGTYSDKDSFINDVLASIGFYNTETNKYEYTSKNVIATVSKVEGAVPKEATIINVSSFENLDALKTSIRNKGANIVGDVYSSENFLSSVILKVSKTSKSLKKGTLLRIGPSVYEVTSDNVTLIKPSDYKDQTTVTPKDNIEEATPVVNSISKGNNDFKKALNHTGYVDTTFNTVYTVPSGSYFSSTLGDVIEALNSKHYAAADVFGVNTKRNLSISSINSLNASTSPSDLIITHIEKSEGEFKNVTGDGTSDNAVLDYDIKELLVNPKHKYFQDIITTQLGYNIVDVSTGEIILPKTILDDIVTAINNVKTSAAVVGVVDPTNISDIKTKLTVEFAKLLGLPVVLYSNSEIKLKASEIDSTVVDNAENSVTNSVDSDGNVVPKGVVYYDYEAGTFSTIESLSPVATMTNIIKGLKDKANISIVLDSPIASYKGDKDAKKSIEVYSNAQKEGIKNVLKSLLYRYDNTDTIIDKNKALTENKKKVVESDLVSEEIIEGKSTPNTKPFITAGSLYSGEIKTSSAEDPVVSNFIKAVDTLVSNTNAKKESVSTFLQEVENKHISDFEKPSVIKSAISSIKRLLKDVDSNIIKAEKLRSVMERNKNKIAQLEHRLNKEVGKLQTSNDRLFGRIKKGLKYIMSKRTIKALKLENESLKAQYESLIDTLATNNQTVIVTEEAVNKVVESINAVSEAKLFTSEIDRSIEATNKRILGYIDASDIDSVPNTQYTVTVVVPSTTDVNSNALKAFENGVKNNFKEIEPELEVKTFVDESISVPYIEVAIVEKTNKGDLTVSSVVNTPSSIKYTSNGNIESYRNINIYTITSKLQSIVAMKDGGSNYSNTLIANAMQRWTDNRVKKAGKLFPFINTFHTKNKKPYFNLIGESINIIANGNDSTLVDNKIDEFMDALPEGYKNMVLSDEVNKTEIHEALVAMAQASATLKNPTVNYDSNTIALSDGTIQQEFKGVQTPYINWLSVLFSKKHEEGKNYYTFPQEVSDIFKAHVPALMGEVSANITSIVGGGVQFVKEKFNVSDTEANEIYRRALLGEAPSGLVIHNIGKSVARAIGIGMNENIVSYADKYALELQLGLMVYAFAEHNKLAIRISDENTTFKGKVQAFMSVNFENLISATGETNTEARVKLKNNIIRATSVLQYINIDNPRAAVALDPKDLVVAEDKTVRNTDARLDTDAVNYINSQQYVPYTFTDIASSQLDAIIEKTEGKDYDAAVKSFLIHNGFKDIEAMEGKYPVQAIIKQDILNNTLARNADSLIQHYRVIKDKTSDKNFYLPQDQTVSGRYMQTSELNYAESKFMRKYIVPADKKSKSIMNLTELKTNRNSIERKIFDWAIIQGLDESPEKLSDASITNFMDQLFDITDNSIIYKEDKEAQALKEAVEATIRVMDNGLTSSDADNTIISEYADSRGAHHTRDALYALAELHKKIDSKDTQIDFPLYMENDAVASGMGLTGSQVMTKEVLPLLAKSGIFVGPVRDFWQGYVKHHVDKYNSGLEADGVQMSSELTVANLIEIGLKQAKSIDARLSELETKKEAKTITADELQEIETLTSALTKEMSFSDIEAGTDVDYDSIVFKDFYLTIGVAMREDMASMQQNIEELTDPILKDRAKALIKFLGRLSVKDLRSIAKYPVMVYIYGAGIPTVVTNLTAELGVASVEKAQDSINTLYSKSNKTEEEQNSLDNSIRFINSMFPNNNRRYLLADGSFINEQEANLRGWSYEQKVMHLNIDSTVYNNLSATVSSTFGEAIKGPFQRTFGFLEDYRHTIRSLESMNFAGYKARLSSKLVPMLENKGLSFDDIKNKDIIKLAQEELPISTIQNILLASIIDQDMFSHSIPFTDEKGNILGYTVFGNNSATGTTSLSSSVNIDGNNQSSGVRLVVDTVSHGASIVIPIHKLDGTLINETVLGMLRDFGINIRQIYDAVILPLNEEAIVQSDTMYNKKVVKIAAENNITRSFMYKIAIMVNAYNSEGFAESNKELEVFKNIYISDMTGLYAKNGNTKLTNIVDNLDITLETKQAEMNVGINNNIRSAVKNLMAPASTANIAHSKDLLEIKELLTKAIINDADRVDTLTKYPVSSEHLQGISGLIDNEAFSIDQVSKLDPENVKTIQDNIDTLISARKDSLEGFYYVAKGSDKTSTIFDINLKDEIAVAKAVLNENYILGEKYSHLLMKHKDNIDEKQRILEAFKSTLSADTIDAVLGTAEQAEGSIIYNNFILRNTNKHTKKDQVKAKYANAFIGKGIANSSTASYLDDAKQANIPFNDKVIIDSYVRAFVSFNGARYKNYSDFESNYVYTRDKAFEVLDNGGIIYVDNNDNATREYNKPGEGKFREELFKRYKNIDGTTNLIEEEKEGVSVFKVANTTIKNNTNNNKTEKDYTVKKETSISKDKSEYNIKNDVDTKVAQDIKNVVDELNSCMS